MKKICIIYPVSGADKDTLDAIEVYAKQTLSPDFQIDVAAIENGFPAIETEIEGVVNGAEVAKLAYKKEKEGYDGILVFCFDDPGGYGCTRSNRYTDYRFE